ncbi:hypothetical protein R0J93_22070, partial [Pseudoalteromonas sp. SIMBA_148]
MSDDTVVPSNSDIGYESLETITINADARIDRDLSLRVDDVEVPLNAGETYSYSPNQTIEIRYDETKRHSDDNVTLPFEYTYTDTALLEDDAT